MLKSIVPEILFINKKNNTGDKGSPCLRPIVTSNMSEIEPV